MKPGAVPPLGRWPVVLAALPLLAAAVPVRRAESNTDEHVAAAAHHPVALPRVRSLWIGRYHVVTDRTGLRQVVAHFGKGVERDTIMGGVGEEVVCYRLVGAERATLLLESTDLGGPGHAVLGFRLSSTGQGTPAACPALPVRAADVRTDDGLRLGLSRSTVIAKLSGMSVRQTGADLTATAQAKVTNGRGTWDLLTEVRASFRAGRVSALRVWTTETS